MMRLRSVDECGTSVTEISQDPFGAGPRCPLRPSFRAYAELGRIVGRSAKTSSRPAESGTAAECGKCYGVQGAVTTQLVSSAHNPVASKALEPPLLAM